MRCPVCNKPKQNNKATYCLPCSRWVKKRQNAEYNKRDYINNMYRTGEKGEAEKKLKLMKKQGYDDPANGDDGWLNGW